MSVKRKLQKKKWRDRRSKKLQQKWYGREERINGGSGLRINDVEKDYNNQHQFKAQLPQSFSLIDNTQETIGCFNRIINVIEKKKFGQKFFLDASEVKFVTIEALIYMIAVVYNIKANRMWKYSFEGNLPREKEANEVFKKSGYLNYFRMKQLKMPDSSDCVQIVSGTIMEPNVARNICDFVIDKLQIRRSNRKIKILYRILVELMTNTAKHAYQNRSKTMVNSWYLYAIHEGEKVRFSFVDTGEGIPSTIKKKILELVNPKMEDSKFIEAAFVEEGRSETGLSHRGKGLRQLYKDVQEYEIDDFFVLSGAGSCLYNEKERKLELLDYPHKIYGTIFSFTVRKENVECI